MDNLYPIDAPYDYNERKNNDHWWEATIPLTRQDLWELWQYLQPAQQVMIRRFLSCSPDQPERDALDRVEATMGTLEEWYNHCTPPTEDESCILPAKK
jgi:hypothetical protein